jgi:signal recognition particle subunit SRP54
MGGMASMLDKLPGMGQMAEIAQRGETTKMFGQLEAIICSMTPGERHNPDVINGSRKKRIAAGAGTDIAAVNRLLKQHKQMQKMMKKITKGGGKNFMRGMSGMMGGMRPGPGGFPRG